jgi:hypothetical protein
VCPRPISIVKVWTKKTDTSWVRACHECKRSTRTPCEPVNRQQLDTWPVQTNIRRGFVFLSARAQHPKGEVRYPLDD